MNTDLLEEIRLTAEQQQFAELHHATAGTYCADNRAVCLYSKAPRRIIRWIVDKNGVLLETTPFAQAA